MPLTVPRAIRSRSWSFLFANCWAGFLRFGVGVHWRQEKQWGWVGVKELFMNYPNRHPEINVIFLILIVCILKFLRVIPGDP